MDVTPKVYVDRQGTDEICSSLPIAKGDNGYVIIYKIDTYAYKKHLYVAGILL